MTLASASAARMQARFAGRLSTLTLTRTASSALDPDDPTAAPTGIATNYSGEGYAFDYEQSDIDGTRVMRGDFRVTILRSLAVIPEPGDAVTIPPPGEVSAKTVRIVAVEAVTEAFTTVQVRG